MIAIGGLLFFLFVLYVITAALRAANDGWDGAANPVRMIDDLYDGWKESHPDAKKAPDPVEPEAQGPGASS